MSALIMITYHLWPWWWTLLIAADQQAALNTPSQLSLTSKAAIVAASGPKLNSSGVT